MEDVKEQTSKMQHEFPEAAAINVAGCPQPATITIDLQKLSGDPALQLPMAAGATLGDLCEAVCKLESCDVSSE